MKRAIYEWAWIFFAGIAAVCWIWWGALMITDRASNRVDLAPGWYIRLEKGTFIYSNEPSGDVYYFDNFASQPLDRVIIAPD